MKERFFLSKYADYGNRVPGKMLWTSGVGLIYGRR